MINLMILVELHLSGNVVSKSGHIPPKILPTWDRAVKLLACFTRFLPGYTSQYDVCLFHDSMKLLTMFGFIIHPVPKILFCSIAT